LFFGLPQATPTVDAAILTAVFGSILTLPILGGALASIRVHKVCDSFHGGAFGVAIQIFL